MSKIRRFVLYLIPLGFIVLFPIGPAWSADEDMVSQVYLEFDPETGEFKAVQDSSLSDTSQHAKGQSRQIEQIQQRQNTLSSSQSSTPAAGQVSAAGGGIKASSPTLWAGGILVLGLLSGAVFLVKKNQHKAIS